MNRSLAIQQLQTSDDPFDLLIVGGGASGLGAAVDAASRGHSVALVEQADFAKGTSSRSTKLVHGGVRYLQQGNIALVLEALRERGRLSLNAPHLVHTRSFVIPNYSWWEGPFYGIGMKVYDQMAGKLGLSPSRTLSREETLERIPTIEQEHLLGGVIYFDGQFDDARLAIHLAMTATDKGACLVNRCTCTGLIKEQDMVTGAAVKDEETGQIFSIKAKAVINATGIFVDELRMKDDENATEILVPSQGIHIVLPKRFLPGNSAIMIPKTEDGRVLFAVPWHDCVIVGTTDTPVKEKTLEPRALPEEITFIMTHARKYLNEKLTEQDILSVFAGLRPLVKSGKEKETAALSRDHSVLVSPSGLITLTGGKWTTYRKMAEDVVNEAETVGGLDHLPCLTQTLQIHGWTHDDDLPEALKMYGSDAQKIECYWAENPELAEKVHPDLPLLKAEVVWHVREEMARSVEDVLARRSRCLLLNAAAAIEAAPETARLMAIENGKDADWQLQQIQSFTELASGYLLNCSHVST